MSIQRALQKEIKDSKWLDIEKEDTTQTRSSKKNRIDKLGIRKNE
jgi:hypothetical protein